MNLSSLDEMDTVWFIDGQNFCCMVWTKDGVIGEAAPILKKFIGQPINNLLKWKGVTKYENREFKIK